MADFTKLEVWKASHAFALRAYQLTAAFPPTERFGLTQQIRGAAASIGSNIAEGCGRHHTGDQIRFLYIAKGSAKETRSRLMLARDLGFIPTDTQAEANSELEHIEKMLERLIRGWRKGS